MENRKSIINNYISVIDAIYGVYLDSTLGFKLLNKYIQKIQRESIRLIGPEATIEKLDKAEFIYGRGSPPQYKDPSNPNSLHKTTQGVLKERNKESGINFKTIGNLSIVQIYQFWENNYRDKIAQAMNLKRDELKSDIFGELRCLRESILHHSSFALPNVEKKVKVVKFKGGEEIFLKKNDVRKIVNTVKIYLNTLRG